VSASPYWSSPDGRIALYRGDCLDVLRTLPDDSVDAVITDPPYSSGGAFRGDRTGKTTDKYVSSDSERKTLPNFTGDNRDQRAFAYWCALWLSEARRIAVDGAPIVQFTDWRQLPVTTDAVQSGGWIWRGIGVWAKPTSRPQMGRFAASSEYFVWGSNGPMPEREDVGCLPGFILAGLPRYERDSHVTPKPIELMSKVIGICPPGGTVLDPFAGGGSTLVAAYQQGRKAIGVEMMTEYLDRTAARLEAIFAQGSLFGVRS
jgi:site-specific DNA-methyltransferase (adenine-specific)